MVLEIWHDDKGNGCWGKFDRLMSTMTADNNQRSMNEAYSFVNTELSKQVKAEYLPVVNHVLTGCIELQYAPTDVIIANIFTFNFKQVKFTRLMKLLGMEWDKLLISSKKSVTCKRP